MSRQRAPIARAVTLVALATCFAVTTAAFNATYVQQAEADARLSNGADVVVTAAPGGTITPTVVAALARLRGVASLEPIQHRYAYIGTDLQDLYGVKATTIVRGARLQDAWFSGGLTRNSASESSRRIGRSRSRVVAIASLSSVSRVAGSITTPAWSPWCRCPFALRLALP